MGQPAAGPKGERGERGERGPSGPEGKDGEKGKDGTVSWNALSDDQKNEIISGMTKFPDFRGPKGDKGDQGPAGKDGRDGKDGTDGSSDANVIASKLIAAPVFMTDLGKNIASQSTKLTENIAGQIVTNEVSKVQIAEQIAKLSNFQTTMINKLSEGDTKLKFKGDTGDVASAEALKTSLINKTLWCADGDICKIPGRQDNKGLGIALERNQKILLSSAADPNHGIAHKDAVGVGSKDGPTIWGWEGGQLASRDKNVALEWDGKNVGVIGELFVHGSKIHLGHGWKIDTSDGHFRVQHNNYNKLVVHNTGSVWAEKELTSEEINLGHNWRWVGTSGHMELQKDKQYRKHFD